MMMHIVDHTLKLRKVSPTIHMPTMWINVNVVIPMYSHYIHAWFLHCGPRCRVVKGESYYTFASIIYLNRCSYTNTLMLFLYAMVYIMGHTLRLWRVTLATHMPTIRTKISVVIPMYSLCSGSVPAIRTRACTRSTTASRVSIAFWNRSTN